MKSNFQPIQRAVEIAGSQAELARQIPVSAAFVHQWMRNVRPVPSYYCKRIEEITGGKVTRKELLPDSWDKHWPELRD